MRGSCAVEDKRILTTCFDVQGTQDHIAIIYGWRPDLWLQKTLQNATKVVDQ